MADDRRPEKSNKKSNRRLNVGIIFLGAILVYLVVYFCSFAFNAELSAYEVVEGACEESFAGTYNGFVLRSETVVKAADTGYINFFVGDSTPVYVGQQTYLIDVNGEITSRFEEAARDQAILNANELAEIKDSIFDFDTEFKTANYYDVYNFKYKVESQVLDIINNSVFGNLGNSITGSNYTIFTSDITGIIEHNIDGYEDYSVSDIEASLFRKNNYSKQIIKSNDLVMKDAPVYKVITSENWYVVIQIDNPDDFEGIKTLDIEFLKDNVTASCDVDVFTSAGNSYVSLALDKYMIRYAGDRYLQIRICSNEENGLKIPKTSVAEQDFYVIPVEFKTQGGNSEEYGFVKQISDKSGDSVKFINAEIVKEDDVYCYVSTEYFEDGDIVVMPESAVRFTLNAKEPLQGVYVIENNANVFTFIDILGNYGNSYIVSSGGPLKVYDQIIGDVSGIN